MARAKLGQDSASRPRERGLSGADLRGGSAENPVEAASAFGSLNDLGVDSDDGGFEGANREDSIDEMWLN